MSDHSLCLACATADGTTTAFWTERRRFLSGLLPVRRQTVTITFQKAAARLASAGKPARLAV